MLFYLSSGGGEIIAIKNKILSFDCTKALGYVLEDLLEQIKTLSEENKEASYVKIVELFLKAADINQKLNCKEE
ncbi:MAG: hypothetical protein WCK67_13600 [bacterium]